MYRSVISQKLQLDGFEEVKDISLFNEDFIKSYNKESNIGYLFEVEVKYPEQFHKLRNDLPFLPERMRIERCKKLVCSLFDIKKIRYTHKISKRSNRSWINVTRSA